jgi:hypothetical protein
MNKEVATKISNASCPIYVASITFSYVLDITSKLLFGVLTSLFVLFNIILWSWLYIKCNNDDAKKLSLKNILIYSISYIVGLLLYFILNSLK